MEHAKKQSTNRSITMRFDWEDVLWLAAFVITIVAGAAIH
jgi:hypothetical protein